MCAQGGADDPRSALARLVTALADTPTLERAAARRLLRDLVVGHLGPGRELHLAEYDEPRQWFTALVLELAREPGGLAALRRAVTDLQPDSRLARQVDQIVAAAPSAASAANPAEMATVGGPGAPPPVRLTPVEIRELAVVFGAGAGARHLLITAGLPAERIPIAASDAATFWVQVSWLLGDGLIVEGRRRVLAAAAASYPFNAVFAAAGS
ncbi:effector-associated domain EAD1-containing protein [Frankia sp. Ag45/Mut15]|uniref:Effector-associated domain EAD1-containing protein n=1 Tax=Frankia umida TaxID=573489 RepID=A0ABT0K293_9ACTN|nr:effector-associated domain EAD1-containing protein [Frankia umida]MCK9877413.1 effector-associated domain EAD1-containing protein [Frankia umida]